MATAKTVDELSSEDRKVVVASLDLKAKSVERAAKAASSDAVREAYMAEYRAVVALQARFR